MHDQRRMRTARRESTAVNPARTTILLADDDDECRSLLKKELVREGYDVVEATDGIQALELLSMAADGHGDVPDVVVLDVCMPGYSGLGVLKLMRRFAHLPPTLLITGFADLSVDLIAKSLGAVRVFHKPLDLDEVLAAVRDAAINGAAESSAT
jgi:DNA-binding response OmpR family regulator